MDRMTYDHEKVHFNLARLKKGGHTFEVDVDPDKAVAFRNGKLKNVKDVLIDQHIFADVKKGLLASENEMNEVFGTEDRLAVAEAIIKDGDIQVTAQHRKKVMDEKKRKIIGMIHRNGVDPRTHSPHPATRIENAFEEAKIKVDEQKSAESQLQDIIKKLRPILPIKFEVKEIEVKIPAAHAAKSFSLVKRSAKILRNEWLDDGSWFGVIEIPGGLESDFYDELNKFTHGSSETKVLAVK